MKILLDKYMALCHMYTVMKRTTIWLTGTQAAKLKALSKRTGIRVAELIRRFVDEGLRKKK